MRNRTIVTTLATAPAWKRWVANCYSPKKHARRRRIVLPTADGLRTAAITRQTGKSKSVGLAWAERFVQAGGRGPVARQDPATAHLAAGPIEGTKC
jgi:hypothetical protein